MRSSMRLSNQVRRHGHAALGSLRTPISVLSL